MLLQAQLQTFPPKLGQNYKHLYSGFIGYTGFVDHNHLSMLLVVVYSTTAMTEKTTCVPLPDQYQKLKSLE